jgi:hypothetical protein
MQQSPEWRITMVAGFAEFFAQSELSPMKMFGLTT